MPGHFRTLILLASKPAGAAYNAEAIMIVSSELHVLWPDADCNVTHAARQSDAGLVARDSLLGVYRCSLQMIPPHQTRCAV